MGKRLRSKEEKKGPLRLDVIYARDNELCHLCKEYVPRKVATLDHLIRKAEGGTFALSNLALAHLGCNNARHNKTPHEFIAYIAKVRNWYIYVRKTAGREALEEAPPV